MIGEVLCYAVLSGIVIFWCSCMVFRQCRSQATNAPHRDRDTLITAARSGEHVYVVVYRESSVDQAIAAVDRWQAACDLPRERANRLRDAIREQVEVQRG